LHRNNSFLTSPRGMFMEPPRLEAAELISG
jgi:hypothetical protein